MIDKIPKQTLKKQSSWFAIKSLHSILLLLIILIISRTSAQDLVLENMSINGVTTFSTINSIIAGPNFTISSTGSVTLEAGETITLIPNFVIISNGELSVLTGFVDNIEIHDDLNYPDHFFLNQNYPNPFNPLTTITYELPKSCFVKMTIYDIQGKEIITLLNRKQDAGYHSITWDSKDKTGHTLPSGLYLYQLKAGEHIFTKKLTLIK